MDVFEKMVLDEQDTDKKFLDATSFFMNLKEQGTKTAAVAKGEAKLPSNKELKESAEVDKTAPSTGKVQAAMLAREQQKRHVARTGGTSIPLTQRTGVGSKGGFGLTRKARLVERMGGSGKSVTPVDGARFADVKIKKTKKVKIEGPKKVKTSNALIKTAAPPALSELAKYYAKRFGGAVTAPFGKDLGASGMRHAFRPPTHAPPSRGQRLSDWWARQVAKAPGHEGRVLKKINKERVVRGLPAFTKLKKAQKWMAGFERGSDLSGMLGIPTLGKIFADPAGGVSTSSALQGLRTMGIGPSEIGAVASVASKGAQRLGKQSRSMSDYNKYILPAAAATGAGGLGYLAYKKMSGPKQEPLPAGFQGFQG